MRYLVILAALIMQLCLGATYSWSVYVQDIRALLGLSQAQAQIPFSVFYFVFPATMVVSGLVLNRIGPRFSAMLGGALFASGWIIGSFGLSNFSFTILGNGVLAGIGAGIAYIVPISTCMKWFPHQKGLVTGIAVAGFGGGAALVSKIGGYLLAQGATPFDSFKLFGIGFLLLVSSYSSKSYSDSGDFKADLALKAFITTSESFEIEPFSTLFDINYEFVVFCDIFIWPKLFDS